MTNNNFLNVSNLLFRKRMTPQLYNTKTVNDIKEFIIKWNHYFLDENDSINKLQDFYEKVKTEKQKGIFSTILIVDNTPKQLSFIIHHEIDKVEYIGYKKVSADILNYFKHLDMENIPEILIYSYLKKKMEYDI